MILAAFVSFISFLLVLHHLPPKYFRRLVGYVGWADLILHGTILFMFLGTSTLGLLQAEAAGILFSLYLRTYRWAWGTERWELYNGTYKWVRRAGHLTKFSV